jgi:hypothetical protein
MEMVTRGTRRMETTSKKKTARSLTTKTVKKRTRKTSGTGRESHRMVRGKKVVKMRRKSTEVHPTQTKLQYKTASEVY